MDPYLNMFDEMPYQFRKKAGYSTGVVVGVIALIIVVLAIIALNKSTTPSTTSNTNTPPTTEQTNTSPSPTNTAPTNAPSAADTAALAAAQAKARTDLVAVETRLKADQNYDTALASIEGIEATMENAFANSTGASMEFWNEIKVEFDRVEANLKAKDSGSLPSLATLITDLQANVGTL